MDPDLESRNSTDQAHDPGSPMARYTSVLPLDAIIEGIGHLAGRLIPPFGGMPAGDIVEFLQKKLQADAAAIFLVSGDDPSKLVYAEGTGYTDEYKRASYFLNGRSLTSWVYSTRRYVSGSRRHLQKLRERGDIEFSGKCQAYITSKRFTNIISVPILLGERCVGVLKVENKAGRGEDEEFPPEDVAVSRVLAAVIAVAYQQGRYRQLWEKCEAAQGRHRSVGPYLQEVTSLLSKFLNAESASVFLNYTQAGEEVLKYAAGVGYKEAYEQWVYKLDGLSMTAYVAEARTPLRMTEEELRGRSEAGQGSEIPYRGACRSFIGSSSFRGLIAVPLVNGEHCLGVMKVENKLPDNTHFDKHDLDLCQALAREQIVPTLLKMQWQQRDHNRYKTEGYVNLTRTFGESRRLRKEALRAEAKKVADEMKKQGARIKVDDCAAYLQISRPHFYRLIRS